MKPDSEKNSVSGPTSVSGRPNLFDYLDYRLYLTDYFAWRREDEPSFSLRIFMGKVSHGLASSGILSAVLKGKRKLSPSLRVKFIKAMALNDKESQYFTLLVQFNEAKSMDEKNHFFTQLGRFRASKAKLVKEEQFGLYAKWYYLVVWCYFGMDQKQRNPAAISKRLRPSITAAQVEEAITLLLRLGLIRKTANGYATTDAHINTEAEVRELVAQHHHKEFLDMATQQLDATAAEDRQYQTLVFSASRNTFDTVKERMLAFQEELREIFSRDKNEDMIYTLNMQLFPNTRLPESVVGAKA
jgi:uncharacterized protein (TIGR02147 family)